MLFDILNLLPYSGQWFEMRGEGVVFADVCPDSGHLAGPDCPGESMLIPAAGIDSEPCRYHPRGEFVLPPAMEWYYRQNNPEYTGAKKSIPDTPMQFIYPQQGATLNLPRQLSGEEGSVVFRVAHHKSDATLWWHLDGVYVGETSFLHEMRLSPPAGSHTLFVVDQDGYSAFVRFTVSRQP